ncbi:MAG: CHRD domain-containing protein [Chloroflexota bacterium]
MKRARFAFLAAGLLILALASVARAAETFTATLDGANSVPPVAGDGSGSATVTISDDGQSVSWEVSYSGLTGAPAAGHIHIAAATANGPVMIPFATVTATGSTGTFNAADYAGGDGLPADWAGVLAAIRGGNTYVNIHTAANPSGEIRGQLAGGATTPPTDTESLAPTRTDGSVSVLLIALTGLGFVVALRRFGVSRRG